MDQLNDAPIQVKALALIVLAGIIFAGFYFLLLEDVRGATVKAEADTKTLEAEVVTLKRYEDTTKLKQLQVKEDGIRKRVEANRDRLPPEENIADLFEQMAERATVLGLELGERVKLPIEYDDYVKKIPVRMEVTGSFPNLLKYMRAMTEANARLTTVSQLSIKAIDFKDQLPEATVRRRRKGKSSGVDDNDAARELIARLDAYKDTKDVARMRAEFVVTAYSYTGKLVPDTGKKKKRRRRRRR